MRKSESVSVAAFFPMTTQQEVFDFMNNADGLYDARCNGLYEYLFLIRGENQKQFADGLMGHLFTEEYRKRHYWPSIE